jgi:hypothetical protein
MKLEQIKAAVDHGLTVHWGNYSYTVVKDSGSASDYSIVYDIAGPKENRIGLTWSDGWRMSEDEGEFFVPLGHLGYAVDSALSERHPWEAEQEVECRYVGFLAPEGYLWVAVWSYLGDLLDVDEAAELAIDLLLEKKWFADESQTAPSIVI